MRGNSTSLKHHCIHVSPGGECLESVMPAVFEAALVHSETHQHRFHPNNSHHHIDQSTSALIYVTIVVVFYVIIIAVLISTTIRRRAREPPEEYEETRHLLLYDEKSDKVKPTTAFSTARIEESGLCSV